MKPSLNPPPAASSNVTEGDPNPGFVVVDASVWVSRLIQQDAFHQIVKAWMEIQRSKGIVFLSPALLLAEVAGVISRRTGEPGLARNAIDRLTQLPGLKLVEMDQQLVQEAARLAADLGLRGANSFYVAAAVRLDLPLATLDADQKSKAASAVALHSLEKSG